MATTTNYSWTTPDDTALVKDGAAAIRSLGTAIDTTVFNNAGAAIAKTIVDAKGDLIVGTAADTVARLASSASNGNVLTVDTSTASGLKWAAPATPVGGLNLIDEIPFTSSTTINFDNIFTSTYKNYRLHFVAKNVSDNQVTGLTLKMRASGSSTSAGYESQEIYASSTTIGTRANFLGTDEWYALSVSGNNRGNNGWSIDLFSPNLSSYTAFNAIGLEQVEATGRPSMGIFAGVLTDTTAYDGISILSPNSLNLTGTLFVYGYAKE